MLAPTLPPPRTWTLGVRAASTLLALGERTPARVLPIRGERERCGVLLGERAARCVRVLEARFVENVDARSGRFELDSGGVVAAALDAEARRLAVVGFFHSHPRGAAVPSLADRAGAWNEHVVLIAAGGRLCAHWPVDGGFVPLRLVCDEEHA